MADWSYEQDCARLWGGPIAGVDEVGRGPLAGPVVAAAVILNPSDIPEGLDDSKKLSPRRRAVLFEEILARACAISLGQASAREIDALNIRQASHLAMRRAAAALIPRPQGFLIDGKDIPLALNAPARAIVKGDSLSVSIAAASIVAKVMRDRQMKAAAREFPHYGFEIHSGYPTVRHFSALKNFGPCRLHRRSFSPVRALFSKNEPLPFTPS